MTEGDKRYGKGQNREGECSCKRMQFDGSGDGVSSISLSGGTVLKRAEASHIHIWWKSFPDIHLLESEGVERDAEHTEEEKVRKFSIKSKILNNQVCKRGRKQDRSLSFFFYGRAHRQFIYLSQNQDRDTCSGEEEHSKEMIFNFILFF